MGKTALSAADVKMEIPVLVRSLKSSILSSISFQMGDPFWRVVRAAVYSLGPVSLMCDCS